MFCGNGSFRRVDEDPSAPWTPKGCRKKGRGARINNPYSTRGLDKFSTVQAELEARREKIMAQLAGSQGVSTVVRFMYSNSRGWIPVVVRLQDIPNKQDRAKPPKTKTPQPLPARPTRTQSNPEAATKSAAVAEVAEPASEQEAAKRSFSCGLGGEGWRWRHGYLCPLVMVVILVCLVVFGRVFAICCTSIWWYLVPIIKGEGEGEGEGEIGRRSMKSKDYGRRVSDKRLGGNRMVAPSFQAKRVGGVQELISPRSHVIEKRG